jgi:hypothetical protein
MKPLPYALLQQLEALPDETFRIVLNTNRQGHWEIEITARFQLDEPPKPEHRAAQIASRAKGSRISY